MPEKLMTLPEVAEYLNVPPATLYAWRYRNAGPRSVKVGRHVRYRRSDVEKYLDRPDERGAA